MSKTLLFILLLSGLISCKTSKSISSNRNKTKTISVKTVTNSLANEIVKNAESFNGVTYRFGGITNNGMDCSGLIYVSFKKESIILPRISRDMAKKGVLIKLSDVIKGDLLFFQTNKNKNEINHVGLVVTSKSDTIEFIHATTSKGVITSFLSEQYWLSAFKEARRVL